jgi:hypothetical protein
MTDDGSDSPLRSHCASSATRYVPSARARGEIVDPPERAKRHVHARAFLRVVSARSVQIFVGPASGDRTGMEILVIVAAAVGGRSRFDRAIPDSERTAPAARPHLCRSGSLASLAVSDGPSAMRGFTSPGPPTQLPGFGDGWLRCATLSPRRSEKC